MSPHRPARRADGQRSEPGSRDSTAQRLARCARILVIGCPGAGKTRFARRLGAALDLEPIHLDDRYWRADGSPTPPGEWDATVQRLVSDERWLIDGNYPRTLPERLRRADGVVFLDVDRWTCLRGAIGRGFDELRRGDTAHVDADFLRTIWRFWSEVRPRVVEALHAVGREVTVVRPRRRAECDALLNAVQDSEHVRP